MIYVKVHILDWTIKKLLGKETFIVKLQDTEPTIKGLINRLDNDHEGKLLETILKSNTTILINGRNAGFPQCINANLQDGDEVAFIPLLAGG